MGIITLKKNILPAYKKDTKSGLDFMNKIKKSFFLNPGEIYQDTGVRFSLGFEAIIKYNHLTDSVIMRGIAENLKQCFGEGYSVSIHAPLTVNSSEMDVIKGYGKNHLESLVEFADSNKVELIVAHPGLLRKKENFKDYSETHQQEDLLQVAEVFMYLNRLSNKVKVTIENKPNPSNSSNYPEEYNEVLISPIATTYRQIAAIAQMGLPITFDTAHYGITKESLNRISAHSHTGKELISGFFEKDCTLQTEISQILCELNGSIMQIHYNDYVFMREIDGFPLFLEGVVPRKGDRINSKDIIPFIKIRAQDGKNLDVLAEVMEEDYSLNKNAFETIKDFLYQISKKE